MSIDYNSYIQNAADKLDKFVWGDYIGLQAQNSLSQLSVRAYVDDKVKLDHSLESTDNLIEDGSTAADHIIQKPKQIRIKGSVSNNITRDTPIDTFYKNYVTNTGIISRYVPSRTQSQLNFINEILIDGQEIINDAGGAITDAEQILANFGVNFGDNSNHIESFTNFIEECYTNKYLITVKEFGRTFKDMLILNSSIKKDNEYDSIDFTLDLKQLRTVKSTLVPVVESDIKDSISSKKEMGINSSVEEDISNVDTTGFLFGVFQ